MLVIASCTQSKRGRIHEDCRLRNYGAHGGAAPSVYRAWSAGVARSEAPTRPVVGLYKGAYWSAVLSLVGELGAELRVISAGFGLVGGRTELPAYSATFASGHADSVPGAGSMTGRRDWWSLLGGPQQLVESMRRADGETIVVLPGRYLGVVASDLLNCTPEKCWVLGMSCPKALQDHLGPCWIQLDARMVRPLKTNVSALVPAAALHISRAMTGAWSTRTVGERIAGLIEDDAKPLYPTRRRQSPEQVSSWLMTVLAGDDPPSSANAALRRFRGEGLAFEQKRFHRLFRSALAARDQGHS